MIIKHSIYFVVVFCCCVFSVQAQKLYYYHRGDSISLSVNSQHYLVYADANKISMEELNKEFKITESIETGQNGILEVQVNLPNVNYDSVVNVLKTKEYIIDIEPVIGDSVLYNTSRLFYVKLHTPQDYSLLSSMASSTGAEIRGEVSFCENWYELCVNKNSIGNSIEIANQFWESQYFSDIDPGFILHFEPTSSTICVSDSHFDEQWGMQAIKACSAWKITKGDTNVRIAVIDRRMRYAPTGRNRNPQREKRPRRHVPVAGDGCGREGIPAENRAEITVTGVLETQNFASLTRTGFEIPNNIKEPKKM